MNGLNVGIIGANGYGGVELVRLLAQHPNVHLTLLVSRSEAGRSLADVFPHFYGSESGAMVYVAPSDADWSDLHVCFFATPHTVAMSQTQFLLERGIRVIDLSADFRLNDRLTWEQWYGTCHTAPELIEQAVYGLPELNREAIKSAHLIACPGCYPTAVQLGLMPLLQQQLLTDDTIIIDAKSGVSGAGRSAKNNLLFAERAENFEAYATNGHRHYPEIKQQLEIMQGGQVKVIFTPHLLPAVRGIHATIYAKLKNRDSDVHDVFARAYQQEPFVTVLPPNSHPQTQSVATTNNVQIAVSRPPDSEYVTILVVEDNLIKGAGGQALQCMNLIFGLPETMGLEQLAAI